MANQLLRIVGAVAVVLVVWYCFLSGVRPEGDALFGGVPFSHVESVCRCLVSRDADTLSKHSDLSSLEHFASLFRLRDLLMRIYIKPIEATSGLIKTAGNKGYRIENYFFRQLHMSPLRVMEESEANAVYIPVAPGATVKSYIDNLGKGRGKPMGREVSKQELQRAVRDIPEIDRSYFYVVGLDGGIFEFAGLARPDFIAKAIAITNTADPSMEFDPTKDISAVCNADPGRAERAHSISIPPDRLEERDIFAFFVGTLTNTGGKFLPVRQWMVDSFEGDSRSFMGNGSSRLEPEQYESLLSRARFCLAPRGNQVWSPRLIEYIWFGCIPVIVADEYTLPLSCFIDWRQFSVYVPEERAMDTRTILDSIPEEEVNDRLRRVWAVKRHLTYNVIPESGDAYDFTLLELFMRQTVCPRIL